MFLFNNSTKFRFHSETLEFLAFSVKYYHLCSPSPYLVEIQWNKMCQILGFYGNIITENEVKIYNINIYIHITRNITLLWDAMSNLSSHLRCISRFCWKNYAQKCVIGCRVIIVITKKVERKVKPYYCIATVATSLESDVKIFTHFVLSGAQENSNYYLRLLYLLSKKIEIAL